MLNPALPPSVVPLFLSLFSYLSTPAFPPSVTTHHSSWTPKELAPLLFFSFVCLFPIGCDPRFPFCCFFRFQSPRSLRIDCHQSLSGMFLPLSASPARPRRTFGYTVSWSFSARGFRRFPFFCCYRTPAIAESLSFTPFLSFPGFRPTFPFSFLLVVSTNSLTGLPNLVSAWFLLSGGSIPLQWSPDLEDYSPFYKRRRLHPLYRPFGRSIMGISLSVQVIGCLRKQAHAC